MKRILFVDDNELLCRLGCEILRTHGYQAVPAYSGKQALEEFGKDEFDVVVTDFRMEGMDGLELTRALHKRVPALPVIMVTGYGTFENDELHVCMAKDNLFPDLLEQIERCLNATAPARS